ncbi:MAG: hypothetical protein QG597_2420 [Actinomycetota bacterium]|nr:hypothetical protein [Actinomycetota bacterium]
MRLRAPIVTAAIALAAVTLTACGGTSGESSTPASSIAATPGSASAGAPSPVESASAGDIAFAQLMIPHHEQAVQMADVALDPTYGASPQVQALATQIKAAQGPEIAQMQQWLAEWGAPSAMASASTDASGDMPGMDMGGVSKDGMMTDAQMSALAAAKGPAFDQLWLQMMISHHEGAIAMAEDVSDSTNPQVKAMAASIITGQQAEISTMQGMLAGS